MDINIKILNYLKESKDIGRERQTLINIDQFLVHVKNEKEFVGSFLIQKIDEMELDELISHDDKKHYFITSKGLDYLQEHSEK